MSTIIVIIIVDAIIAADFAVCCTVGKAVINAIKYIISSIKKAFRH